MPVKHFEVLHQCGQARCGRLHLAQGQVDTPVFMPVGTRATVKGMTPQLLKEQGASMLLANAWHLLLRPGADIIQAHGGLHRFMAWSRPILTDSGGYQVYSLSSLRTLSEEGVRFRSPIDGKQLWLDAEVSIQVQHALASDIMMVFDECTPYPVRHEQARQSMQLSMRWAQRSLNAYQTLSTSALLFAIVQGGIYTDLRKQSADYLIPLDFHGYALGGLALGESQPERKQVLSELVPYLPADKPRYLMGMGLPEDIVWAVAHGVDMFDCVIPTRHARNAFLYSRHGLIRLRQARYRKDLTPIDAQCTCYTCQNYSRAYLHHLDKAKEPLVVTLNTIHNLHYYLDLMHRIRTSIAEGRFQAPHFGL